VLELADIAPSV